MHHSLAMAEIHTCPPLAGIDQILETAYALELSAGRDLTWLDNVLPAQYDPDDVALLGPHGGRAHVRG